jgi:hypothetical protein
MKWPAMTIALLACGTRTELRGEIARDASAQTPQVVCHPGDPSLVLATTGGYAALATDGAFVYGTDGEVVWAIRASGGGDRKTISPKGTGPFDGLVAGDDGVYFNAYNYDASTPNNETTEGVWVRHDGLASRTVHWGAFAPPVEYFAVDGHVETAPLDDAALPLDVATVSNGFLVVASVTDNKVYVIESLYGCDRIARIDRTTATVESFDWTACNDVGPITGPNAVCGEFGCMLDEATTPIPMHGALALDATYAYTAHLDGLHRVELRGDADVIFSPLQAHGVAVANGCIYVETTSELVRIAAPP